MGRKLGDTWDLVDLRIKELEQAYMTLFEPIRFRPGRGEVDFERGSEKRSIGATFSQESNYQEKSASSRLVWARLPGDTQTTAQRGSTFPDCLRAAPRSAR